MSARRNWVVELSNPDWSESVLFGPMTKDVAERRAATLQVEIDRVGAGDPAYVTAWPLVRWDAEGKQEAIECIRAQAEVEWEPER